MTAETCGTCGTLTVAYQGAPGANGERAIAAHWNGQARPQAMRSFSAVLDAVADGSVEYGLVPVWNSTIGRVHDACATLERSGDRVEQVAHVTLAVRHALLALPGASLHALRAVGSHPAALEQCRAFIARHAALTPVAAWDTAGAAAELAALGVGAPAPAAAACQGGGDAQPRYVAPAGDAETHAAAAPWHATVPGAAPAHLAVIASADIAAPLGLTVLAADIQDEPDNRTRFAVVRASAGARRW